MSSKQSWVVQKDALEIVISLLENVPTRNGIRSSEYIKVSKAGKDGATFHLSSSSAGKALIRTGEMFPFEKDLYLDRRLFVPFINGGKESKTLDYIFTGSDNQLVVRHGNRRAVYTHALPITGYEDPTNLDNADSVILSKKWTGLIDCADNYATPDPVTPSLNCVRVTQSDKHIKVMSFNQKMAFIGKADSDKKPIKGAITFPLGLVQVLKQEGATRLLYTNKLVVVDFPKGKIWQAVKTAARKKFPYADLQKMFKETEGDKQLCSIPSHILAKAVDRLSTYTGALDSTDLALEVHLEKGSKKVQLKAGVADSKFTELIYASNEAKETIVLEWPLEGVLPIILFGKDEGSFRITIGKKGHTCLFSKSLKLLIAAVSK